MSDEGDATNDTGETPASSNPGSRRVVFLAGLDTPPATAEEFGIWWIRSARAAVLGEPEAFDRWPSLATSLSLPPDGVIDRVCRTILRRLESDPGPSGDDAVVDAEDLLCLRGVEPERTRLVSWSGRLDDLVTLTVDAAGDRVLASEGVAAIRAHADAFPLPGRFRLPAIDHPLDHVDLLVGTTPLRPIAHVAAEPEAAGAEVAMFDGGRPSTRMMDRFAGRRGDAVSPRGRFFVAEPKLDAWWGVRIRIEGDGAETVLAARLGSRALDRLDVEEPGVTHFETSLAGFTPDVQSRLIGSEIMLRTSDGGRFSM